MMTVDMGDLGWVNKFVEIRAKVFDPVEDPKGKGWAKQTYGLDLWEEATVVGKCVEYEKAKNMWVCRFPGDKESYRFVMDDMEKMVLISPEQVAEAKEKAERYLQQAKEKKREIEEAKNRERQEAKEKKKKEAGEPGLLKRIGKRLSGMFSPAKERVEVDDRDKAAAEMERVIDSLIDAAAAADELDADDEDGGGGLQRKRTKGPGQEKHSGGKGSGKRKGTWQDEESDQSAGDDGDDQDYVADEEEEEAVEESDEEGDDTETDEDDEDFVQGKGKGGQGKGKERADIAKAKGAKQSKEPKKDKMGGKKGTGQRQQFASPDRVVHKGNEDWLAKSPSTARYKSKAGEKRKRGRPKGSKNMKTVREEAAREDKGGGDQDDGEDGNEEEENSENELDQAVTDNQLEQEDEDGFYGEEAEGQGHGRGQTSTDCFSGTFRKEGLQFEKGLAGEVEPREMWDDMPVYTGPAFGEVAAGLADLDPLQLLFKLWPAEVFEEMAAETNAYADVQREKVKAQGKKGRHWAETNAQELIVFFGLWVAMALKSMPAIVNYWETDDDGPLGSCNFGRYGCWCLLCLQAWLLVHFLVQHCGVCFVYMHA